MGFGIHQFTSGKVTVVSSVTGERVDIPDRDIQFITTSNEAASPGGTFSIGFKPPTSRSTDYLTLLRPDDFVEVYLANAVEVAEPRLEIIGLIDRISRNRSATGDYNTVQSFNISGRDAVGKILMSTELFWDPTIHKANSVEKKILDHFRRVGKLTLATIFTPDTIIPFLIQEFAGFDGQWVHPQTKKPFLSASGKLFNTDNYVTSGEGFFNGNEAPVMHGADASLEILSMSGKLWPVIDKFADRLLNDLHFDVLPDPLGKLRPSLVLREHPYDQDVLLGDSVDEVTVYTDEVMQEDLGKSDADLANIVKVLTGTAGSTADGGYAIVPPEGTTPSSIRAHGIRRMYPETVYPFERGGTNQAINTQIPRIMAKLSKKLAGWHTYNDLLLNGSLRVGRLRNDIRVGNRLKYVNRETGDGFFFLVEGVQHGFQFAGASTTTLSVVRGFPLPGTPAYKTFAEQKNSRTVEQQITSELLKAGTFQL